MYTALLKLLPVLTALIVSLVNSIRAAKERRKATTEDTANAILTKAQAHSDVAGLDDRALDDRLRAPSASS